MALRQDESDKINEQVDNVLDRTKKRDDPFKLADDAKKNKSQDQSSSTSGLNNAEENPTWENKYTGERKALEAQQKKRQRRGKAYKRLAKRKGPLTAIILTVVGGGIGISALLSPGLLIVQFKEAMVSKFNTQLAAMDIRTTKILAAKMKTTSGICGSTITIACKYSSMSEKQLSNFEKAGIKVNSDKTTITGRVKPTGFEFEGRPIAANEFVARIKDTPSFRSAVKLAYNPKLAGLSDSIWSKAANYFRISKKSANLAGVDDEAKLKTVQEDIKNGSSSTSEVKPGDIAADGHKLTQAEADAANKAAKSAATAAEEVTENGTKSAAKKVLLASAGTLKDTTFNVVKITGTVDAGCLGYYTLKNIAAAAKTVRTLQLARYAMLFLNTADQIKAGTAKPEDVSYLGSVLTTPTASEDGTMKSATDSFGYKYAAYGETSTMPTSAARFMAGGGLPGKLSDVTTTINSAIGGAPETTCKFLNNWAVQGVSLVAGGAAIILGVFPPIGALDAIKIVGVAAITLATAFLPAMLEDIVAGVLVDSTTVGEDAGDAITSGASGIMGTTAKYGGNAPLTPSQAVEYNNLSNSVAAEYNAEDRLAYSPFDITNSNTFMGNMVSKLTPYIAKMSSLSGIINSAISITTKSIASITSPITKAADDVDNYTTCQDPEYKALGVATDPFCNIVYGIPPEALDAEPITVANDLLTVTDPNGDTHPQITPEGVPTDYYKVFIENCINRTEPIYKVDQMQEDNNSDPSGFQCMFDTNVLAGYYPKLQADGTTRIVPFYISNRNYYLYSIDSRIESGMDGV
jgi:hypothetical protein